MIAYGIQLSSGEYEDYRTEIKVVFLDKEKAISYMGKYNRILHLLNSFYDKKYNEDEYDFWYKDYYFNQISLCKIVKIEIR